MKWSVVHILLFDMISHASEAASDGVTGCALLESYEVRLDMIWRVLRFLFAHELVGAVEAETTICSEIQLNQEMGARVDRGVN